MRLEVLQRDEDAAAYRFEEEMETSEIRFRHSFICFYPDTVKKNY